jgi:hypothetical protein
LDWQYARARSFAREDIYKDPGSLGPESLHGYGDGRQRNAGISRRPHIVETRD